MMKTQIEIKSAFLGMVLGVLAMLVLGAGAGNPSAPVGRFQVAGGSAGGEGHFMIVDTATGQGWCARLSGNLLQQMNSGFTEKKLDN